MSRYSPGIAALLCASLAIGAARTPQEAQTVRGGYAACQGLEVWRSLEALKQAGEVRAWNRKLAPLREEESCVLTQRGEPVEVVDGDEGDGAVRILRLRLKGSPRLWVSREALEP